MLAGDGDLLPVSALPVDGTFPTGTARVEKRALADRDPDLGSRRSASTVRRCALVCPHAAIRMKVLRPGRARRRWRPRAFRPSRSARTTTPACCSPSRSRPTTAPAAACASTCARRKSKSRGEAQGASTWSPSTSTSTRARARFDDVPRPARGRPDGCSTPAPVKGVAGARAAVRVLGRVRGCGETPYLKLLTQLLRRPRDRRERDRLLVDLRRQPADDAVGHRTPPGAVRRGRTRCSRTTPSSGSASASRSTARSPTARRLLDRARARRCGDDLAAAILAVDPAIARRRRDHRRATRTGRRARSLPRAARRRRRRRRSPAALARRLAPLTGSARAQERVDRRRRRLGLRHRRRRPRPRARLGARRERARARHRGVLEHRRAGVEGHAARRGREVRVRRQGHRRRRISASRPRRYGDVYVAQVAIGANDIQTVKAFAEAEAWPGPSLIIAYSTCIAHGIDMTTSMSHQQDAVRSGYWPLYRYQPGRPTSTRTRSSSTARTRRSRSPTSSTPRAGSRCWPARIPSDADRAARARAGRRRRAVALLRPARRGRAHRSSHRRTNADEPE